MKICLAQLKSKAGDISHNMELHKKMLEQAIQQKAGFIIFPELSITGYEPKLAQHLAVYRDDKRFDIFQKLADKHQINIGIGVPLKEEGGVLISMLVFSHNQPRQIYSKQHLHLDELPYFKEGDQQLIIEVEEHKIAFAICYESLLPEHAKICVQNGANVYVASVAKPARGIERAYVHYPEIARKYNMSVLMSNAIGFCDNFEAAGSSAVWDSQGKMVEKLDENSQGVLIYDLK